MTRLWGVGFVVALASSLAPTVTRPAPRCPVWTVVERAADDDNLGLVACVGPRREVGWLDLYNSTSPSAPRILDDVIGTAFVFATNLLVDPPVRRCGVATSLLVAAEGVCRDWGHVAIVLSATPDHLPSWNLYRSLGYRQVRAAISAKSASVVLCKLLAA
mmetsp:Transcript_3396/g.8720  ORF Transcript_3396/g.8720 Transcript_3396/m.8720 type:complete len:160 (+) Transcript_3396:234-713(+)